MTSLPANRGPRFVFVTDTRRGSGKQRFGWRLDAANNRPLGRGVGTHPSLDACLRRVVDLRADPRCLTDVVTFDSVRGLWSWRADRDGVVCAVAVRTYQRRFECHRAAALFRSALVEAGVDSGVVRPVRADVLDRYDAHGSSTGAAAAS